MSEPAATGQVPAWDVADRMRKALREADVSVNDMADYLQVARNTVSTWINGHIMPSGQTIRLWALRTGVPFTWLCHGDLNPCDLGTRDEWRSLTGSKLSMQRFSLSAVN